MTMNIKYRPLKAFLLAVETKSFTLAASRLAVTQPSFTSLIQDLESVLGVRLFERTTRSIALTAAGQELLERIERPIADLEEAYRSMQDLSKARRGAIVMGALPSISLTLVPQALEALNRTHPGLQVRVVEAHNDELISMLRTNQIEFALATLLDATADFEFEPLIADAFCAVYPAGHPVDSLARLTWRDLAPHDLVLLSQGSSARAQFERALNGVGAGAAPTGLRYDVTHMATATQLVRRGMGLTLLPRLALSALNMTRLKSRPLEAESARRMLGVAWRKDRHLSPGAQMLVEKLRDAAEAAEAALPAHLFAKGEKRRTAKAARVRR
jgi:DNA-binding transcriptional LysR family regulator